MGQPGFLEDLGECTRYRNRVERFVTRVGKDEVVFLERSPQQDTRSLLLQPVLIQQLYQ